MAGGYEFLPLPEVVQIRPLAVREAGGTELEVVGRFFGLPTYLELDATDGAVGWTEGVALSLDSAPPGNLLQNALPSGAEGDEVANWLAPSVRAR